MDDFLKYFGFISLGSVTIVSIIGFIAKSVINTWLNSKIENYKATLSKEVEEYKSNLQRLANEHNIRYSKLHNDRAMIIEHLYSQLFKMEKSMREFINPVKLSTDPPRKEKGKTAVEDANSFVDFYYEKKIFFSENICNLIENINKEIRQSFDFFIWYSLPNSIDEYFSNITPKQREIWVEAWDKIDRNVPELRKELEDQFRELLGVSA